MRCWWLAGWLVLLALPTELGASEATVTQLEQRLAQAGDEHQSAAEMATRLNRLFRQHNYFATGPLHDTRCRTSFCVIRLQPVTQTGLPLTEIQTALSAAFGPELQWQLQSFQGPDNLLYLVLNKEPLPN